MKAHRLAPVMLAAAAGIASIIFASPVFATAGKTTSNAEKAVIETAKTNADFTLDDWTYKIDNQGNYLLSAYNGSDTDVVIPGQLNGKQVYVADSNDIINDTCKSITFQAVNGVKVKLKGNHLNKLFRGYALSANVEKIDASGLDISGVTDLSYAFAWEESLKEVDLTGWDTSKVTSLNHCFSECYNLTTVNGLNTWDTSLVTSLNSTFFDCSSLKTVNLTGWNTSKVTDMSDMFFDCSELTDISSLSGFDTSAVTKMYSVFYLCNKLSDITSLSGWDVSNVQYFYNMFDRCAITDLTPLSNWNPENALGMGNMFSGCSGIQSLSPLSSWNVSKLSTASLMFYNCSGLTDLTGLENWDVSSLEDASGMFSGCSNITSLKGLENWKPTNIKNMLRMFYGCSSLEFVTELRNWVTPKIENIAYLFADCRKLKAVDLSGWDVSNIDMNQPNIKSYVFGVIEKFYSGGSDPFLAITNQEQVTTYSGRGLIPTVSTFDPNGGVFEGSDGDPYKRYNSWFLPDMSESAINNELTEAIQDVESSRGKPTRTGYNFTGWKEEKPDTSKAKTQLEKTYYRLQTTFKAQWAPIQYKIRFHANGGKGTMADQTLTYNAASSLTKNSFSRTGYVFAGWSTSPDEDAEDAVTYQDGEKVKNLTETDGDVIHLYAMWTKDTTKPAADDDGKKNGSQTADNNNGKKNHSPAADNYSKEKRSPLKENNTGGNQTLQAQAVKNSNSKTPNTGDAGNTGAYLLMLSASCMAAAVFARKRHGVRK